MVAYATGRLARMAGEWTQRYGRSAEREGWGLFSTGGEFGPFEIERDDERDRFADDEGAVAFVIDLAERGSARAWEALVICAASHFLSTRGRVVDQL